MAHITEWSEIEVENVRDASRLISCKSIQPLKILNPQSHTKTCHVVTSSYGGGMVAGDQIKIKINCLPNSTLFLSSQANTKIYKNETSNSAGQHIEGKLDDNAFAVVFPDPIVPQKSSRYRNIQHWDIKDTSLLLIAEWLHSGRMDIGEKFLFDSFFSEVKISNSSKTLLLDRFHFDPKINFAHSVANFGTYQTALTFYLVGDEKDSRFQSIKGIFEKNKEKFEQSPNRTLLLFAMTQSKPGIILIRMTAHNRLQIELACQDLMDSFKEDSLLGFNPWVRKY